MEIDENVVAALKHCFEVPKGLLQCFKLRQTIQE